VAQQSIRVGLNLPAMPPLSDLTQIVYLSRAVGLNSFMVWDHFQGFWPNFMWNESFSWMAKGNPDAHAAYDYRVILGHLASRAGRLRIGVGVTEAIRHHPVSIAQSALTLSHITKRPPVLGIGAGERSGTEPYGLPFDRLATRVEETLQIVRRCLDSNGPIDFTGKIFQLDGALMDLRPKPGNKPEIWVAAHGPRMLRLTGRYADGWMPAHPATPEEYARQLGVIHEAAREAGRDPDAITPALVPYTYIASTDEEAYRLLDSPVGRFTAFMQPAALWAKHGRAHPLGDDFRGFVDLKAEAISPKLVGEVWDTITMEMMLDSAYVGSPESLARRFREFGEAGMRVLLIFPHSPAVSRRNMYYLPRGLWRLRRLLA
jgi:phthiodiolone/phenolphthiodiolone dimycocerosates ketoreductase